MPMAEDANHARQHHHVENPKIPLSTVDVNT